MSFFSGGGGSSVGSGIIRIGAVTSGIRGQVRGAVRDIRSELNTGAKEIEAQGSRWNRAFGAIGAAAKVGLIGVGIGVAGAVAAAVSFESAFAGVVKTVDAAPAVLERLRMRFRAMATEIPISANEFAALGEAAGALGVKVKDIEEFTRVTALIGVTTNVASEQAATSLGQLGNVLDLTSKDYSRFASTLVDLGNKGASTESQILEIAARAGAVGHNIGLTNPAILAFSSAIANLGIEVEAGGTALQFLFTRMGLLLSKKDKLAELGKVAGMTGGQFKKAFLTDAQGAIVAFLRGLAKLDPVEQAVALDQLGLAGARTTRAYTGLAASLDKNLIPAFATANTAWKQNTALQAEADKRFKTTASQLQLLKNRLIELFLSLGDRVLPGFNELIKWVNDKLPAAFALLADVWNRTLGPAVSAFAGALGRLLGAIGGVVDGMANFGASSKGTKGPETVLMGIATAASTVVTWLSKIADLFATLLSNPAIKAVTQLALAWVAFRIAVSGGAAAVGRLQGASGRLLSFLTGGRLGASGAGAPVDPAAAALKGAATQQEIAARELQASAAALKGAATAQLTGGDLAMAGLRNTPNRGGPIQYVGQPGPAVSLNGDLARREREAFAKLTAQEQQVLANLAQPMAQRFAETTRTSVLAGLRGGLLGAVGRGRAAAGRVIGGAAKLFWPAIIADLGLELVKAPIGEFIAANTPFKRAGESMKKDFFAGLMNLVSAWNIGSDLFVDLPNVNLGKSTIKTSALGKFNLTDAQIAALQGGGLGQGLAESQVAPEVIAKLQQQVGEDLGDWYFRVVDELKKNGINTDAIEANFKTIRGFWDQPAADKLDAQLKTLLNQGIGSLTRSVLSTTTAGLQQGVVDAVKVATGGRVTLTKLTQLPPATYTAIAKLLVNSATGALDPKVLAVTLSGLLNDPKYKPKPTPFSALPFVRGGKDKGAVLKVQIDTSRAAIAESQKALDDYIKNLTPDQATAREYGVQVLDMLNSGVADAGKDQGKRAKFLADINKALGLTGEAKMSWTDLIDWRKQLSEDTGATAQAQIAKRLKEWSVNAARVGAAGGAEQFWKSWGPQIEAADTTQEREALRQKINKLIPGKADDISQAKFSGWLKDMTAKGQAAAGEGASTSLTDWVGKLLTNPGDAIDELGSSLGGIINQFVGAATGDPDLLAKLGTAGANLLKQLASLWNSPEVQDYLSDRMSHAISTITRQVPSSPVRAGPLKHPFLPKAGANIIKQIADGMAKTALTMPAIDLAQAAGSVGLNRAAAVTLHANNLNVLGPADEASLTARLAFLANR